MKTGAEQKLTLDGITLDEREQEMLLEAEYIHRRPDQGMHGHGEGWFKPLHVGGSNRSHHSRTLRKMSSKGLLETERNVWVGSGGRGSRRYRITSIGLKIFKALKAAREAAKI